MGCRHHPVGVDGPHRPDQVATQTAWPSVSAITHHDCSIRVGHQVTAGREGRRYPRLGPVVRHKAGHRPHRGNVAGATGTNGTSASTGPRVGPMTATTSSQRSAAASAIVTIGPNRMAAPAAAGES